MGNKSYTLSPNLYPTHIFIVFCPSSTSSFVRTAPSTPFIIMACFTATASNHPQRLGLPVVAPYSPPFFLKNSPSSSFSSVGKGPPPVYRYEPFYRYSTGQSPCVSCQSFHPLFQIRKVRLIFYDREIQGVPFR